MFSWSGFKLNVFKEMASSFFKVHLWTKKELLEALFANYAKLDEDLRGHALIDGLQCLGAVGALW